MQQTNQDNIVQKFQELFFSDFQNVIFSIIDAQEAINYFEDDPNNEKIIVFLNIIAKTLNQSQETHNQLKKLAVDNELIQKYKLIGNHVKDICKKIKIQFSLSVIVDEYLEYYKENILNNQQIGNKRLIKVSENENKSVETFLQNYPIEKWTSEMYISETEIINTLLKRKGRIYNGMQLIWISIIPENKDYGKPLYLRASIQSDFIFFGAAIVLCLIVAYFMSQ